MGIFQSVRLRNSPRPIFRVHFVLWQKQMRRFPSSVRQSGSPKTPRSVTRAGERSGLRGRWIFLSSGFSPSSRERLRTAASACLPYLPTTPITSWSGRRDSLTQCGRSGARAIRSQSRGPRETESALVESGVQTARQILRQFREKADEYYRIPSVFGAEMSKIWPQDVRRAVRRD